MSSSFRSNGPLNGNRPRPIFRSGQVGKRPEGPFDVNDLVGDPGPTDPSHGHGGTGVNQNSGNPGNWENVPPPGMAYPRDLNDASPPRPGARVGQGGRDRNPDLGARY